LSAPLRRYEKPPTAAGATNEYADTETVASPSGFGFDQLSG
jgi:hypothetical protein